MNFNIFYFLFAATLIFSCGVKSPPLPMVKESLSIEGQYLQKSFDLNQGKSKNSKKKVK